MENPYYYRNKVHAVFDRDRKGNIISGIYEEGTHRVVPVENCLIEDEKSQEIIRTIRGMLKSFKIRTYDEDTGYGLLRHVLIRLGFSTGEIMVVISGCAFLSAFTKLFFDGKIGEPVTRTTIISPVEKPRRIHKYHIGFLTFRCHLNHKSSGISLIKCSIRNFVLFCDHCETVCELVRK